MPLYLDVHNKVEGATTDALAHAHRKDLEVQHKYGVNYLRYWFDEAKDLAGTLVEPVAEAAAAVHREAHGVMADDIIEVKEGS